MLKFSPNESRIDMNSTIEYRGITYKVKFQPNRNHFSTQVAFAENTHVQLYFTRTGSPNSK